MFVFNYCSLKFLFMKAIFISICMIVIASLSFSQAIHTDATRIGNWETFDIEPIGNGYYIIRTFNGGLLTAVGGGGKINDVLHTDAVHAGQWEKFLLVRQADGSYAIKTISNYYLNAVNGGGLNRANALHSDARNIGSWEKFRIVNLSNGYYAIQTINGNYLTAVNGGVGQINRVAKDPGRSIKF